MSREWNCVPEETRTKARLLPLASSGATTDGVTVFPEKLMTDDVFSHRPRK